MYWNHRCMRRIVGNEPFQEEQVFIVEVYYDQTDNTIIGWTEQETAFGEDLDELKQTLEWMLDACEKPILDEAALLAEAERMYQEGLDVHEVGIDVVDIHAEDTGTLVSRPEVT